MSGIVLRVTNGDFDLPVMALIHGHDTRERCQDAARRLLVIDINDMDSPADPQLLFLSENGTMELWRLGDL